MSNSDREQRAEAAWKKYYDSKLQMWRRESFLDGYSACAADTEAMVAEAVEATVEATKEAIRTYWPDEGEIEILIGCLESIRALDTPAIVTRVMSEKPH